VFKTPFAEPILPRFALGPVLLSQVRAYGGTWQTEAARARAGQRRVCTEPVPGLFSVCSRSLPRPNGRRWSPGAEIGARALARPTRTSPGAPA